MVIPYKQKQQFFPIYVMTKVHFEMIARGRMIEDTQCSGGSFSGLDRSLSLFVALKKQDVQSKRTLIYQVT